jgi:hypothetical protein
LLDESLDNPGLLCNISISYRYKDDNGRRGVEALTTNSGFLKYPRQWVVKFIAKTLDDPLIQP